MVVSVTQAGEMVRVVARVNEEWVEGEMDAGKRRGMFPASFVDRVPPDLPNKNSVNTEPSQPVQVCPLLHNTLYSVCVV